MQPVSVWYYVLGIMLFLLFVVTCHVNIKYNHVDIFHVTDTKSLDVLRKNIATQLRQKPDINKKSVHIWYKELDTESKQHLDRISHEIRKYLVSRYQHPGIRLIDDMTEINASGTQRSNSDMVYFTRHFDAPFTLAPCRVMRVLLAINGTPDTTTVFSNKAVTLQTGMAAIFDYDRSAHHIRLNDTKARRKDDMPRITAKLQFIIPNDGGDTAWCQNLHQGWSVYSRNNLVKNQNRVDIATRIGIIGTYFATYMHYIAFVALVLWVSLLFIPYQKVIMILLIFLCTFIVVYYVFVAYLLYILSHR